MEETTIGHQTGPRKAGLVGRTLIALLVLVVLTGALSCKKDRSLESNQSPLTIHLNLTANGTKLILNRPYTNDLGEDFTVTTFKCYLSNFSIADEQGARSAEAESYHLINAADSSSLTFNIMLDRIGFDRIEFMIGVDSLRNVSGAQTGALDPTNGMFWTWNSGYIMAKLEGSSPASPDPGQRFQYHIGGYAGAEATQRRLSLSFPGNKAYVLKENTPMTLTMDVDLDKWFSSAHDLPISITPFMETPGAGSVVYADNYATMFTVSDLSTP